MTIHYFRFVFVLLVSICTAVLQAQPSGCNNFGCKMDLAKAAFNAGNYKEALDQAQGAMSYDRNKEQEVNKFIAGVFAEIEQKLKVAVRREQEAKQAKEAVIQEKINADILRVDAEKARILADSLRILAERAQKMTEESLNETQIQAQKAQNRLMEYQALSAKMVELYVNEVNDYILGMDYENAAAKIGEAAEFNTASLSFKRAVTEIAFWWNEAKSTGRAAALLKNTLKVSLPEQYDSINNFIKAYDSVWYNLLRNKYYGEMVAVNGSTFIFHKNVKAEISNFAMAKTETTFWQYGLYCIDIGQSISDFQEKSWGLKGHDPVINITWYDAIRYANWLSVKSGLTPVYEINLDDKVKLNEVADGFRLPTETEWEYAAKGGNLFQSFQYAGSNTLTDVAVNPKLSYRTRPVSDKKPNALGIYDMTGNVWEWCYDWYGSYPKRPERDYKGVKDGKRKIVRGGAWNNHVKLITRSAFRIKSYPQVKRNDIGLRIVQSRH